MIIAVVIITIIRTVINIVIYRHEYNYYDHTDGLALIFDSKELEKRDNAVILISLSLITLFWVKYKKAENQQRVILSNILSLACMILLAVIFFF